MNVKQIVADTLRTMMGATAADPYVRAIEHAIDAARTPAPDRYSIDDSGPEITPHGRWVQWDDVEHLFDRDGG